MSDFQHQPQQNHDLTRSADVTASPEVRKAETKPGTPGNQAMQQLLRARAIQAKLNVGEPDDAYEKEADRVADTVMRMPAPAAEPKKKGDDEQKKTVQRKADEKKKDNDKKPVQKKADEKKKDDKKVQRAVDDKKKDEKKNPVQRKADEKKKETDKKPVQRKTEEKKKDDDQKKTVQRAELEREEETIQSKSTGAQTPVVTPQVESAIQSSRSSGHPLSDSSRGFYEPRLGRDLSQVRLHTDSTAAGLASDLNAQAFTQDQDIFFGAGRYQPHTDEGQRLLGHELTHTIQQTDGGLARLALDGAGHATTADKPGPAISEGAVQRDAIQRTNGGPPPPSPPATGTAPAAGATPPTPTGPETVVLNARSGESAILNDGAKTITFQNIEVPSFKLSGAHLAEPTLYSYANAASNQKLKRNRAYNEDSRGNTRQRDVWKDNIGVASVTAVRTELQSKLGTPAPPGPQYVFEGPTIYGNHRRLFIGTLDDIAKEMSLPSWSVAGRPRNYQVDHIVELQVANWPAEGSADANTVTNMQMLEELINTNSGNAIKNNINNKVKAFLRARGRPESRGEVSTIKRGYDLIFSAAVPDPRNSPNVTANDFWSGKQVRDADHVKLAGVTPAPVKAASLSNLGRADRVLIFPQLAGGVPRQFSWNDAGAKPQPVASSAAKNSEYRYLWPFRLTHKNFTVTGTNVADTPEFGTFTLYIPNNDPTWKPFPAEDVEISRVPGAPFAGRLNKQSVKRKADRREKKGTSPIQVESFEISPDEGLYESGQILPDIPLLQGVRINYAMLGNDLRIYKTFSTGDFHAPRPFTVSDSTLTISAGTESGLSIEGQVDFAIERLGQGYLRGLASSTGNFELEGHFSFDTRLFDPAEITLAYRNNEVSASGRLGIPANRVRGIRSATITADYSAGRFDATGSVQFTIPGVQQADVRVSYSEAEGLLIGGSLQLADNIPGIRSGQIDAQVRQKPDGEYEVNARGTAVPAIPGIDSTITVAYENGAITIEGRAAYNRGMLSGSIQVGATNRPLDAEGNPIPNAEPANELRAYGGGTVTIRIAPWLQGTIGVRLLPNGEIEVTGSIGLPSSLDVFPEKRLDKNIFSIGIDIPIVGVAVAGQRIGIFATIRGGLDASAGIGPGQLRELGLTVTYNPAHEDQTHVTGGAQLHIPAHAGLRLFVRGGLGIGIPIVSATAALEIGASLGLEGAVEAGVQVDWTPARGLVLDALGEIYVQPKFRFDVTGMVLVEADLLVTTIELYSKRWNLASFEYGSDLRFGVRFPVHYEEGRPFDISLSDVEFEVPEVDPMDVLSGLIDRIT